MIKKILPAIIVCFGLLMVVQNFIILNTSRSIKPGVYLKQNKSIQKGSYVSFCPEKQFVDIGVQRGYILTGDFCVGHKESSIQFLKKIIAVPGDVVNISVDGIKINGSLINDSVPILKDDDGRDLPKVKLNKVLEDGEFIVYGDYDKFQSYDSRYYGVIKKANIFSVARPIFTWDNK